ncbi:helix-turn-helix domain-containing protein [Ezakiella coagulans]|uniref:helix-turn-helix domain-containing protein n=1 Tax=Ezakiella coagulans TaxID=46507 RepID=UPI002014AC51|nr:helix-turn-helix domain-containing protein [Ezakiella coagulans]UQK60442.1 helix-turn-helix domain containing protein [Ezakiella coagulans]UQK61594.1 helix-turn-helix domain containing protein [Ezakiella coagulans]
MNKITYEEKLKIVKENQEGYGQKYLSKKYEVSRDLIRSWIHSYEILGEEGLKKVRHIHHTVENLNYLC